MSTAARPAGRLAFIDWLRGWALLVMIETHVFNAFLDTSLRASGWFTAVNFVNGLVAPSFLFVSGFVFLVASQKRVAVLRTFGERFWKQVGRVLVIWAVGYLMHLPTYAPTRLWQVTAEEWRWFARADVLHCISATWLFLLLSLVAMRSERGLRIWLCVCAVTASALAPRVWNIEFYPALPAPLAAYLNAKTGSLFPLLPWSAFMLAGAAAASWFLAAQREGREGRLIRTFAGIGLGMILAGSVLPPLAFLSPDSNPGWRADPRTLLTRLGIVLLLAAVCYWVERRRAQGGAPSKVLLTVSRESLFVYVAHLLLIYGPFWGGRSTAEVVGQTQSPWAALAGSVALAALMVASAAGWEIIKQRKRMVSSRPAARSEY